MRYKRPPFFLLYIIVIMYNSSWGQESLQPNPFSPFVIANGNTQPGLAIRIPPPADSTAPAFVRVHVYATDGNRIRALSAGSWLSSTGADFYWDGQDDDGKLVRNGRYLVVIQWSHNAQSAPARVARHSVVVFK